MNVELSDAELAEPPQELEAEARRHSARARCGALRRTSVRPAYGAITTPGASDEVRCYADI